MFLHINYIVLNLMLCTYIKELNYFDNISGIFQGHASAFAELYKGRDWQKNLSPTEDGDLKESLCTPQFNYNLPIGRGK